MSFYFDMPLEELQASVQHNPFELELWLSLIQRVAEKHGSEEALEEVIIAEDIFPESVELQALKSLCLLSVGEVREAHDLLQQALRRSPGDALLSRIIGEFLPGFHNITEDELTNPYAIRDNAQSEKFEEEFMERLESTIDLIRTFDESDPEQLVGPLQRHINNFPHDINAKLDLARLCHNIGDEEQARKLYRTVIGEDHLCASAYFELAAIEPDVEAAIELSERGLDLCPMFECGRYNYAALLLQAGMLEEGRNEMLRIPADSSYYILGLEAIANSHSKQGNFKDAIKAQEKVVALSAKSAEAWNSYGHFFAQIGEYETALLHFDRVIQLDNEHLDGLHNRALMLGRLGRHHEAVHVLKYALTIEPLEESMTVILAIELGRAGLIEEAIDFSESSIQHFPSNDKLWINLGSFHLRNGDLEEAIRCSETATRLDDENANGFWALAVSLAAAGKRAASLSAIRRCLELSPEMGERLMEEPWFDQFVDDNEFADLL